MEVRELMNWSSVCSTSGKAWCKACSVTQVALLHGLKTLFASTRTSCSELRTSCSGRKDRRILWSFRTMTWTLPRLRAVADPWGVGRSPSPEWEWSLKSFFGNQFSQFVVIFLFQCLRNSSQLHIYHPRTVNVSAQFALINQPTMTLILVSLHYVRRIQTWRNLTLRSTCMMSAGSTPKRLRQSLLSILKFLRSMPTRKCWSFTHYWMT